MITPIAQLLSVDAQMLPRLELVSVSPKAITQRLSG